VEQTNQIQSEEQLALFELANSLGSEALAGSGFEDETLGAEEDDQ
jgi:hypothetical protein